MDINNCLPDEILVCVFQFTTPLDQFMTLPFVCEHWRYLVANFIKLNGELIVYIESSIHLKWLFTIKNLKIPEKSLFAFFNKCWRNFSSKKYWKMINILLKSSQCSELAKQFYKKKIEERHKNEYHELESRQYYKMNVNINYYSTNYSNIFY